jgi:hypothetical protein
MQMSEPTTTASDEQAISLFQHFEGNGSRDKEQMISLVTWLVALASGLVAFSWKPDSETNVAALAAGAAILLSIYSIYIVIEFLQHANKNFKKANLAINELAPDVKRLLVVDEKRGITRCVLRAGFVGSVFIRFFWFTVIVFGAAVYSLFRVFSASGNL